MSDSTLIKKPTAKEVSLMDQEQKTTGLITSASLTAVTWTYLNQVFLILKQSGGIFFDYFLRLYGQAQLFKFPSVPLVEWVFIRVYNPVEWIPVQPIQPEQINAERENSTIILIPF